MLNEQKLYVCKRRLECEGIHAIAEEIELTPQTISQFICSLPTAGEKDCAAYPMMEMPEMLSICSDYIHGAEIAAIAEQYAVSKKEVLQIFTYIAARRPKLIRNSEYPSITQWIRKHSYTKATFAAAIGITAPQLLDILGKRKHMPYEVAVKIRNLTGIPLSEIFSDDIN